MDKIGLAIRKWKESKSLAETAMQEAVMFGATKKEVSAMKTYINTYQLFINDLYELMK